MSEPNLPPNTLRRSEVAGFVLAEALYPSGLKQPKHSHDLATLTVDSRQIGKQLAISVERQQAIGLMFSSDPKELSVLADFNQKTAAFIEALRKKDVEAIKAFLPEGWRARRFQEVLDSWRSSEGQKGLVQNYEILGTTPVYQGTGRYQTYVRFNFRGSTEVYRGTWFNNTLSGINDDRLQPFVGRFLKRSPTLYPVTKSFVPQSVTDFVSYDLHTSKVVRISFETMKGGRVTGLVVHTRDGDVVAQKVSSTGNKRPGNAPRRPPN
jgi:hypothetical protein